MELCHRFASPRLHVVGPTVPNGMSSHQSHEKIASGLEITKFFPKQHSPGGAIGHELGTYQKSPNTPNEDSELSDAIMICDDFNIKISIF